MTPFSEMVTIGRAIKPQGRRGEIVVEPLSDRPDRFTHLTHVFVPGEGGAARKVAVSSTWPHKGRVVVKLEGVDSIDAAEGYRGLELRISEADLAALPAGSYYHHELRGLDVVDEKGRAVGRVEDLLETGAATVLVIRAEGRETLVPLAEGFVLSVDVPARRAVVHLPELAREDEQ